MGHGRNGPIDQSQKKPKICKDKEQGEVIWWHFDGLNHDEKNSLLLPEDFVDMMKQINPEQLAEFLLQK